MPSLELKDRLPKYLWAFLLFSALIVQFVLLSDYLIRWVDRLGQYKRSSAILKSVAFSWDQNFADYSQFLREIIPIGARVILPPQNIGIPADHVGYMQYVLFPRDIHNCGSDEVEACIQRVIGGKEAQVG